MKKFKLTKEEQEIEDHIEEYVPASAETMKKVKAAIAKARKETTISLRMRAHDLWDIKEKAAEEGIPYQTFIGSILHKYISHQLVDEKQVKKIISLLR